MRSRGSVVTGDSLDAIGRSRLNPWRTKRLFLPLGVDALARARKLSGFSKSMQWAWLYHDATGCDGVEFEVLSGVNLEAAIAFRAGPVLVPWPNTDTELRWSKVEDARFSFRKLTRVFRYDGWMPNSDWSRVGVEKALDAIGQTTAIISALGCEWCTWHLKYFENSQVVRHASIDSKQLTAVEQQVQIKLGTLDEKDRAVFWNALGLLNMAWNAEDACVGVLSAVSAVEILARQIDSRDSIAQRLPDLRGDNPRNIKCGEAFWKAMDKLQRAVKSARASNDLEEGLAAWREASSVVSQTTLGIEKKLLKQLKDWYGVASREATLFDKTDGKLSLYDIRSRIPHEGYGSLAGAEKDALADIYLEATDLARDYILSIIFDLTLPKPHAG